MTIGQDNSTQAMELDVRSRCWIATFAWTDVDAPTEAVIPTELNWTKAQLKYSKVNSSCSIWLEFDAQQRVSRIAKAFPEREAFIVKRSSRYQFDAWTNVASDYDLEIVRPTGTCMPHRDTVSVQGPSGHDTVVTIASDSDSDVELATLLKRRKALKRKYRDYQHVVIELNDVNARLARKFNEQST